LAEGGFSEIFEIEDPASALPERLILKRLSAEMSARPAVRTAFAEEAKILRELKHPNVVTFRRCYYDDEQRVCLVMEKIEGDTLDRWAQRYAAQPAVVLDLFDRVLSAVDYLHHRSSPFLHLDLKPENVLVTRIGGEHQPVLIDFGIARRSGGTGLRAHTPPYGAPEQVAGGRLDCATDVYALGHILAEILALLGPVPPALAAVAERARNPSRSKRYADAGQMRVEFRRARTALVAAPARSGETSGARPDRKILIAAAAALAAVVLLAGAFLIFRPSGGAPAPPVEAPAEDAAGSFAGLIRKAEQALREGQLDVADASYREARTLAAQAQGEQAQKMSEDLRTLRTQIDLVSQGGPAADTVRLDLELKAERQR
jgi:serine/threonine-protein kinase